MGAFAVMDPDELEARLSAALGRALEPLRRELAQLRQERETAPVTMAEAAHRLGVSLRTVERKVASGELESIQTGRARRVVLPPRQG